MKSLQAGSDAAAPNSFLLQVIEAEGAQRRTCGLLRTYRPYPKQAEFHAAGAAHRERLFLAGNQLGKTLAGANELGMGLGALRSLEKIKRAS